MLKRQIEKHIFSPYDASQKLLLCWIYLFFHHEKPLAWLDQQPSSWAWQRSGAQGCAPDLTYPDRLKVGSHVYFCISWPVIPLIWSGTYGRGCLARKRKLHHVECVTMRGYVITVNATRLVRHAMYSKNKNFAHCCFTLQPSKHTTPHRPRRAKGLGVLHLLPIFRQFFERSLRTSKRLLRLNNRASH